MNEQTIKRRGCRVEGCPDLHYGLGYCDKHYRRFKIHGDPLFCKYRKTTEFRIEGDTGYIVLTQGKWAIVDAKHVEYLAQWRWQYAHGYAKRTWQEHYKKRSIFMHEVIAKKMGYPMVDHKFHNTLDNRESQLRPATCSQNQMNRRHSTTWKGRPVSSRFKGVYWYKDRRKWAAQIKVRGRRFPLGRYDDEEDAALAYNVAAQLFFGEYAHLNPV